MIQQRTILKISDNSGAKTARCLKILGGFKKKYAKLGDIIVVSIQQLRNKLKKSSKVKKKEIYKALIIRINIKYAIKTGYKKSFNDNAVILLNKQENPIGTRILGPVSKNLKKKKLQKLLSLTIGVV